MYNHQTTHLIKSNVSYYIKSILMLERTFAGIKSLTVERNKGLHHHYSTQILNQLKACLILGQIVSLAIDSSLNTKSRKHREMPYYLVTNMIIILQ